MNFMGGMIPVQPNRGGWVSRIEHLDKIISGWKSLPLVGGWVSWIEGIHQ
jgi:hypothetical protein